MKLDLLTIKLIILLFNGIIGTIVFRFCLYEKKDLKVPEFILYSSVFSIVGYLFEFNKFISFLNNETELNIDLNFILLGTFFSILVAVFISKSINNGFLYNFFDLNHSGKSNLVEDIYLKSEFEEHLRYYANLKTEKFTYTGRILNINYKDDSTEFFIIEATLYENDASGNPTNKVRDYPSVFVPLKNSTFSIEFLYNTDENVNN